MFKSRKEARTGRNDSVETIRRQAQYRLAGAAMLVSVAVVSFSLLFDTEPRTLGVEMPIAIPTKDKVQPVVGKQVAQAEARSGAPSSEGVIDEDSAGKRLGRGGLGVAGLLNDRKGNSLLMA